MVESIHAHQSESDPVPDPLVDLTVATAKIEAALEKAVESTTPHVLLLRPTTGAGKSRGVRELIRRQAHLPVVIVVPTHALADQHMAELDLPGQVHVARGVTGTKIDGASACMQHDAASRLARLGIDPLVRLCPSCPARVNHPKTGGACPASPANSGTTTSARIEIVQSARTAEQIATFRREAQNAGVRRLLILDEPPPPVRVVPLPTASAMRSFLAACRRSVRERLEPLVAAVVAEAKNPECTSLDDCMSPHVPAHRIAATQRLAFGADIVLGTDAQKEMVGRLGREGPHEDDSFARARNAIEVIREAAAYPKRVLLHRDAGTGAVFLVSRASWVRELRAWARDGGSAVILDATADVGQYGAVGIGSRKKEGLFHAPLEVVDVHVRDAEGSRRIFYKWASAPRRRHVAEAGGAVWGELQGVLRHLAETIRNNMGDVGIIADQPTARALLAQEERIRLDPGASVEVPEEFAALVRDGVKLRVGWYGATRGLDRWKGVKTLACIGDAFPPVTYSDAIASFLGGKSNKSNGYFVGTRLSQAEVEQAVGRSRSIHFPVTIVVYGSRPPNVKLAPQWTNAEHVVAKVGRPRARIGGVDYTGSELNRLREESKFSKREHAKFLGMKVATYMERTKDMSTTVAPAPWGRSVAELIDLDSMLRWTTEE